MFFPRYVPWAPVFALPLFASGCAPEPRESGGTLSGGPTGGGSGAPGGSTGTGEDSTAGSSNDDQTASGDDQTASGSSGGLTDGGSGAGDTANGTGNVRFDVGGAGTGAGTDGDGCDGSGGTGTGELEFSYIWIANSPEGTLSKVDTITGVELARYRTGPEQDPQPSRTSVNLNGDVAVSNRGSEQGAGSAGSVTKIVARRGDCVDKNGNGNIETSTGPTNVLPWGEDECVIWNTPIASTNYRHGPRPTAWEGVGASGDCTAPNPRLWVGWYDRQANTGRFHRLDGQTGTIVDSVNVPGWTNLDFGPYGGAVDGNGDFWVSGWQRGHLIRIDGETLDVDVHPFPAPPSLSPWSYGMALDQYGNPWIATQGWAAYFDVATQDWGFVELGHFGVRGVMVDAEDRAWFVIDRGDPTTYTGPCGLSVVDVRTRTLVEPMINLPGCVTPVGVAIDAEGFVWVVDQEAHSAFKMDPDSYNVDLTVAGLNAPYTYSDMTGAGLKLVVDPPG